MLMLKADPGIAFTPAMDHLADRKQLPEWERDDRFRKVFNHSNDGIFIIDPERDRILEANPRACQMLGYSYNELAALRITSVHPDEMPALMKFARSVFDNGAGWTNELTCLTKSGNRLPVEISASTIVHEGRTCLLAIFRDISNRSEQRHGVLLEINNAIVANLDRTELLASLSETLSKVFSFDRCALILYDQDRDVFKLHALADTHPLDSLGVGFEIPRAQTRFGNATTTRGEWQSVLVEDLEKEKDLPPPDDRLLATGIRSYISVPLIGKRGPLGYLALASLEPGRFSVEDRDFLNDAGKQVALALENIKAYEEIAALKAALERENLYLQEEIKVEHNFSDIVGRSKGMRQLLKSIETVAPTDVTVLILGETGTGKELVARAVHDLSPRCGRPLVKVNCAALPAGLIESELFGHEKGAFTGAIGRKIGRFELAHTGSIFLDEVGELPLELQVKLLRVLQEGEFERIGNSETRRVNVRVITATNRDLPRAIEEGRFRSDLYYRLNVFPVTVPPLRNRPEDIPLLVRHCVMKGNLRFRKNVENIRTTTMEALTSYPWPGNVRELENVVERAMILSQGTDLEVGPFDVTAPPSAAERAFSTLQELERKHILEALELTVWRVSGDRGAARLLGMKPTTLEARMKKLGISRRYFSQRSV